MTFATEVAAILQDSSNVIFSTTEVTSAINEALRTFSRKRPNDSPELFGVAAGSRLIDLSSIAEGTLVFGYSEESLHSMYGVEYPIDTWNEDEEDFSFRNYSIYKNGDATYLTMKLSSTPSTDGEARLRVYKVWSETDLPTRFDDLVIRLAAGIAAEDKYIKGTNDFNANTTKLDGALDAIIELEGYIDRASNDLASGLALIGANKTNALTAIGNMATMIENIIESTGNAEAFYNSVNVGQPEMEHLRSANEYASAANMYLQQARGYFSEGVVPNAYQNQVSADLQVANVLLGQARAFGESFKQLMQSANMYDKYELLGRRLKAEAMAEINKYSIDRTTRIWPVVRRERWQRTILSQLQLRMGIRCRRPMQVSLLII